MRPEWSHDGFLTTQQDALSRKTRAPQRYRSHSCCDNSFETYATMNLYENRRQDGFVKKMQLNIDLVFLYRVFATCTLVWQACKSVQFQPTKFYHMYTNWTLFLTTILYAMVLFDDIYDVQNKMYHFFMYAFNVTLLTATVVVVVFYWVGGANDLDKAPFLMFVNHSWTFVGVCFEMLLSNNFEYVTGLDFFKYFLPYHYAWCFGLLPILQFRNADPYNLPFSFARDPGITALFVIGTSIALSLVHFSFLRLFAKVQKYLMELKKNQ